MDLFDHSRQAQIARDAPLAARLRPRTLDEFIGQDAVVGPGRLLRRAIQADQLSSLIFFGPPGTGKTTLAQIIANTTSAHFIALNAVLAGVKDIREAIASAQDLRGQYGRRTILFIDEVHRFNKAQQDALLPWVENGTVILIGATTENPYFEVNKALVSRSRIFQLKPLEPADLYRVVEQALADKDRGYGDRPIQLEPAAIDHLVNVANGDARALLNALELAVETTPLDAEGQIQITLDVAEESIQQRAVLYDKEGDAHFDTISAFIKSVRGSDPDAALYWLARMVYAGEDPRFIFRRLVILASEDIGLGDPHAVTMVTSCAAAFDRVGMPEGRYPLAQATLYLATAPKSNSTMGFFDALSAIEQEREREVPNPMRDGNRDSKGFGHGKGYLYPHAYRDHWVEQQYLPSGLQGQVFYQPSAQGYEASIQTQVAQRREAQLAAMVDGGGALPEVLTYSPDDPARDRWLQRTLSQAGEQLGQVRDRIFALALPQRHHRILDLNARTGLLTWEALRQVPEGGVYARVHTAQDQAALEEQAAQLLELIRPVFVHAGYEALAAYLAAHTPGVRFECIVGRNAFGQVINRDRFIEIVQHLLAPGGVVVLAETIPRHSQRISALVDVTGLSKVLVKRWHQAEDAIATSTTDPRFNWQVDTLQTLFLKAGFAVQLTEDVLHNSIYVSSALLQRWFAVGGTPPSYRDQLVEHLSEKDVATIQQSCQRQLQGQTVQWRSPLVYLVAKAAPQLHQA
ncbi:MULTISPECIES: AAA family ATPase [Cyanophyceae]|uniref:AAA family ATPase n=1 Tax=Cyanophyceae TaxID=3028117 RepID=UPI0016899BD7|nr:MULTISPECIES: AAA family ATPase [Cyanophyceae]MBD1919091.1 AAA family ATPase [Phormidium sp. FACHB-77]MBD2033092.1 AAA family ATPase [Phormidium sp. FACHB-322]MBD2054020.1 AAA family ATPase [Leptolyngbya sp. FACHB-60]